MQRKGIERLEEDERNMAVPATETPPIPAAHEARRWRTAALIGGMWKVLAAHHDAISFSLDSVRHEAVHCLCEDCKTHTQWKCLYLVAVFNFGN